MKALPMTAAQEKHMRWLSALLHPARHDHENQAMYRERRRTGQQYVAFTTHGRIPRTSGRMDPKEVMRDFMAHRKRLAAEAVARIHKPGPYRPKAPGIGTRLFYRAKGWIRKQFNRHKGG